ncbi:tryptophan 2,3-dioxygenase family protein [Streptomyces niveus]|uniref:tryptophan 2,3-dioxygenase family protein n=1 Tax=Streptomyces niveus TaxID=193462 RepID=UPI0036517A7A
MGETTVSRLDSPEDQDAPYAARLRLPELMAVACVHDREYLDRSMFLSVHQECEIKFAQIVLYLEETRNALDRRDGLGAAQRIEMLPAFMQVLITQFDLLGRIPADTFEAIRADMGSASGFQSAQWREIEFICGQRRPGLAYTPGFSEQERKGLQARLEETSLDAAFEQFQEATEPDDAGERIADGLRAFDETVRRWRTRHADLAEQFLGSRPGTAGSSGVAYLRTVAKQRLFPSLWPAPALEGEAV